MLAKDYRQAASEKLKGNRGTAILGLLIVAVIEGLLSYTYVGTFLVTGAFNVGVAILFLNISRGYECKIENVFEGFKKCYVKSLVAYILVSVFTFLWSLLLVVPGIMKAYSYSQTFYILADHPEMSGKEAIDESKRMMQGNRWRLFCLQFSFIGWFLLCVCTVGILLIWVAPYYQQALTEFYESLKNQGTGYQDYQDYQSYQQPEQQTIDVAAEDVTAEDVTAEDVAAEDVTVDDVTVEDVATDDVKTDAFTTAAETTTAEAEGDDFDFNDDSFGQEDDDIFEEDK